ncbi:MAG TPA: vWA domain-containing protein [Polyangiaceae bacterium]|jgi:hypothetical protein
MRAAFIVLALGISVGCGAARDPGDTDADGGATADGATFQFGEAGAPDATPTGDAACNPPDMLIVLDRSLSMNAAPSTNETCRTDAKTCSSGAQCCSGVCTSHKCIGNGDAGASVSKWTLAEQAVDFVTQAPTDETIRFGLELLPDKGSAGQSCGSGDLALPMGLDNGAGIAGILSTTTLQCCTPIGGALQAAATTLSAAKVPNRAQYALLVTDGGETCTADSSLPVVDSLEANGVDTFVVGFGGKADAALLNDLACAGHTATSFATSCSCTANGCTSTVDATTTHVFFDAADGPALQTALATITNQTCCGCNVPVN